MDFGRPVWLWLLLLTPLPAVLAWLARRRRAAGWRALGQSGRPSGDGGIGWTAAMVLVIIALAQPRWGRRPGGALPPGRDVILLVDVSLSMAAEDLVPDRLGRAVEAGSSLIDALGRSAGDRVGVVAFAGRGVVRCPLTSNLGAAVEALGSLRPGAVEPGGTDLGAGLDAALDAFDDQEHAEGRAVVVLSDGEDHQQSWTARLDRLKALGVVVHSVAIGDAEAGHPLPVPAPGGGDRSLTHRGEVVLSKRQDTELRALALAGGGAFVPLGTAEADLATLYEQQIAPAARRSRAATREPERPERFPVFVLASLAVGLVGTWPRRRRHSRTRGNRRRLALLALAGLTIGASGRSETAEQAVSAGRASFERGDLDGAIDAFERASTLAPGHPIPSYDLAAALFRAGRFDEARARYLEAREHADEGLRMKIDYALGNAAVAVRDIPAALLAYDACIGTAVAGPEYDRIRAFARDNRAFAERLATPGAGTTDDEGPTEPDDDGGPDEGGDEPDANPDAPGDDGGNGPVPPSPAAAVEGPDEDGPAASGAGSSAGAGTPAEQLSDAVDAIREARDHRLPEDARPPIADPDRKPW